LDVFYRMLVHDDRLTAIRGSFPKEGLFAEKDWLISPEAFPIEQKFLTDLEQLGHELFTLIDQHGCRKLVVSRCKLSGTSSISTTQPCVPSWVSGVGLMACS